MFDQSMAFIATHIHAEKIKSRKKVRK